METIKRFILWLALAFACFIPASALTVTAPENRVWEIFSIGYATASPEATDLGNRTETPTSNYDTAPIHRASTETKSTVAERPLFGPNAEFKAAEGSAPLVQGEFDFVNSLPSKPPINWPPNQGFLGTPSSTTLSPGTMIDRFGYDAREKGDGYEWH